MSHKQAIKFVRNQIKILAEYRKLDNVANRYYRKQEQNRPKVKEEPHVPKHPCEEDSETKWFPITALHTVYNYLRGKPNCHEFKDPNAWEALRTRRAIEDLGGYLVSEFSAEFGEVQNASA